MSGGLKECVLGVETTVNGLSLCPWKRERSGGVEGLEKKERNLQQNIKMCAD